MTKPAPSLLDAAPPREPSTIIRQRLETANTARTTAVNALTEIEVLTDALGGADPSLAGQREEAQRRVTLLNERVQVLEADLTAAVAAEEAAAAEEKAAAIAGCRATARGKLEAAIALADAANAGLIEAARKAREAAALCSEARDAVWEAVKLEGVRRGVNSAGHLAQMPDFGRPIADLVGDVYYQRVPLEAIDLGRSVRVTSSHLTGWLLPPDAPAAVPASPEPVAPQRTE